MGIQTDFPATTEEAASPPVMWRPRLQRPTPPASERSSDQHTMESSASIPTTSSDISTVALPDGAVSLPGDVLSVEGVQRAVDTLSLKNQGTRLGVQKVHESAKTALGTATTASQRVENPGLMSYFTPVRHVAVLVVLARKDRHYSSKKVRVVLCVVLRRRHVHGIARHCACSTT